MAFFSRLFGESPMQTQASAAIRKPRGRDLASRAPSSTECSRQAIHPEHLMRAADEDVMALQHRNCFAAAERGLDAAFAHC